MEHVNEGLHRIATTHTLVQLVVMRNVVATQVIC